MIRIKIVKIQGASIVENGAVRRQNTYTGIVSYSQQMKQRKSMVAASNALKQAFEKSRKK